MDELLAQARTIGRAMWRRRWIGLAVAWVAAIAGALAVMRVPDHYEATARVYVDTKSVLKPLMRELTVEPDIDQTLQMLARTLITRPNVDFLMKKGKLETPGMSATEREAVISRLMNEIKLNSFGRDNVFTFSYRDTDPVRARQIVDLLVNLFVQSDLGAKMRDVDSARGFIDQQIKTYEGRLAEAENRLKDFKLRNLGSDTGGKDYFARISQLTEELAKLNLDLRAAEQSRDALKRELSGETVQLVPDVPQPQAVQTTELDNRIEAQRRQLDELLRRYTDLHPDVVSTRRLIERLDAQKQQELQAMRRAEAASPKPTTNATGTMYQQTRLALAESEATVAALRVRANDTQARLAQLRASASRVPQLEAELTQLNRDYDVVRRNYEALVAQREKALMSEEVDQTRLAHFRVIEPPRTGEKPVFPNRVVLAAAALIASLVAGVAATFVWTQLVPTVDDARGLQRLSGRQVLGSVSMLRGPELIRRGRRQTAAFAAGMAGLLLVYGAWLALLSVPGGA